MDPLQTQSFDSEDGGQPCENPDNIELGNHEPWLLNDWQQEEDVLDQLRDNDVSVQHWLQKQGNSQPSQGTFITSLSLHRRKRENSNVLVHVENVFGGSSKPSSVQAIPSFDPTALRPRKPTTSNVVNSIDERLQQKPRPTALSFKPSPTTTDRKTRYSDNANHNEGNPLGTLTTQDQSAISTTAFGPSTHGSYKQSAGPLQQQAAWSVAGTDASSTSKKPPKRQNSRSIDDDTSGKQVISKRNRSGINGQSWRRTSPVSSGSVQAASTASLQPAVPATSTPQRRSNVFSSTSADSSSSSVRRNATTQIQSIKLVSHEDFVNRCETCPFWLHEPDQFSSIERQACFGRKEEVSHIVTHISDHHGLIRGKDPKNSSRKYLSSCQTHSPSIKAKGECAKCSSLHNWKDEDFADSEHHGAALCLRCWCRFDKRSMKAHIAAPMCTYNSEQLKQKKVCVLYTTFCSETKSPGGPPRNMAPRRSIPRPASTRSNGSHSRQQPSDQPARRPNPTPASQDRRLTTSHLSYGQGKHSSSQTLSLPGPAQDQSVLKRRAARSHQPSRIHNQQATTGGQPIWQQSNTYRPSHQPIAYVPIYPDTSLENIAGMVETMQRNGYRESPQSFHPETKRSAHFGNMSVSGNSPDNGFRQPGGTQAQSLSLQPSQYYGWEHSPSHPQQALQRHSRAFSNSQQQSQSYGNVPLAQIVQHGIAPPAFFEQSPSQFPRENNTPTIEPRPQLPIQPRTANIYSTEHNEAERLLFQACYDAATMPQLQPKPQHQTVSMSDLDATLSMSGALSHVQSSPSRVASTAGESMGFLNSPDAEETHWLNTGFYDGDEEVSWLKSVGSHPVLQEEEPVGGSQPPPLMDHFGDLKPDGCTPAMQQTSMEKDSAYYSLDYDDADFGNNMFT
ncbi:hypothetical protein ACHAPU_007977 [Fusarium lateritium]